MSIILSKIDLKKRFGFGFGRNSDKSRNSVSVAKLSFGRTLMSSIVRIETCDMDKNYKLSFHSGPYI